MHKELNKKLLQKIEQTIETTLAIGPAEVLRREEVKKGYRILDPTIDAWFTLEDWEAAIISIDKKRIRIIGIISKEENKGVFSRLINNIIAENLIPVVIAPMFKMVCILATWQWKKKFVDRQFEDREEIWMPTSQWIKNRLHTIAKEKII